MLYQEKASKKPGSAAALLFLLISFLFAASFSCSGREASGSLSYADAESRGIGKLKKENESYGMKMSAPLQEESLMMDRAAEPEKNMGTASLVSAQSPAPAERKKTWSGGCTVRTASPAAKILEAGETAKKYKGWIESSSDSHVTIRIPAGNFRAAFRELMLLGDLIDKYEESSDVTDYYADLSGRLDILKKTRGRLENLLHAENKTEKKVPILRELKRIDDQIESLKAELETLEKAVNYSVITVNFIPFSYGTASATGIMFPWIESLDPFNATINDFYRRVSIKLPDGFAVPEKRGAVNFHAESADGTILRIGTLKNIPSGDSGFWQKAIISGIGGRFSEATPGETGSFRYALFTAKGGGDYRYLAGTMIKRKLLYVVEVYFPDSKSHEKWMESLVQSLGGARIK